MRKTALALTALLLIAVTIDVKASRSIVQPPSYEAFMALPSAERLATYRALDLSARLALAQTHIDRWLSENRNRLSARQVELVDDVRGHLTPEQHASDQMIALARRMRCELWRSDALALAIIQDPPLSSSWFNDIHEWITDCVVSKALSAVF